MLTIVITGAIKQKLILALKKAGHHEIGGILMAEHTGFNEFTVREVTIQKKGTFASFLRKIEDAIGHLNRFFANSQHDYERFNYLGEWHSHPLFEPTPSGKDHQSMLDIIIDPKVGAHFVVLIILKLIEDQELVGSANVYHPDQTVQTSNLRFES